MQIKPHSKYFALFLTACVLPGMGQWYLQKKLRGALFAILALIILLGGFARYMSVLFAVANIQRATRPLELKPFRLLADAWSLDHRVLWAFLIALVVIWMLAILDILLIHKEVTTK